MAKVKVKVLAAIVDGHKQGETISVDEKSAEFLERNRYVERVAESKPKSTKSKSDNETKDDSGND